MSPYTGGGGGRGGRGSRASRGGAGSVVKQRGSFLNGVWHCDCVPPLPATHFAVKKEGPNKGRWFRTCQKEQKDGNRCGFFLWDTDAAPRENAALAVNSRTEPGRAIAPSTPKSVPPRVPSPMSSIAPVAAPSFVDRKRSRGASNDHEDEFGVTDAYFDAQMDQALTDMETPSKKPKSADLHTPVTRRRLPWQPETISSSERVQMPQSDQAGRTDLFPTGLSDPVNSVVSSFRFKPTDAIGTQTITPGSSPANTPTPSRFKTPTGGSPDSDLTQDVLSVLRASQTQLGEATMRDLSHLLSRYATKAEGIRKGRDVARIAIKAKDAKVTELSYRVTTLEAELEAERAAVRHLQWKAESGHQSD